MIKINLIKDKAAEKRAKHAAYVREWSKARPGYSSKYVKAWRASNPDKNKLLRDSERAKVGYKENKVAKQLKRRERDPFKYQYAPYIRLAYGLTEKAYKELIAKQEGLCAICNGPPTVRNKLYVDHCHETGKIRGLLCHHCNAMIGMASDKIEILYKGIEYLNKHGGE